MLDQISTPWIILISEAYTHDQIHIPRDNLKSKLPEYSLQCHEFQKCRNFNIRH
ncbi:hypothetical protein Hanom_Chr10g00899321 [Helianthus anomalus]